MKNNLLKALKILLIININSKCSSENVQKTEDLWKVKSRSIWDSKTKTNEEVNPKEQGT